MIKNTYHVIGVMSGTSLDGIDLAELTFSRDEKWNYRITSAETVPYPAEWQKKLSEGLFLKEEELDELNFEYTALLSEVISEFISSRKIENLDAVCSHGHTIKHEPDKGFTLQIGNLPQLGSNLGQKVVCDFRVQDVELGGQGAPLVPVGDELLFRDYDYCLNLGGFANVSTSANGNRIAYDVCAVNTVLNFLANKMDLPFDRGGKIAASGELDKELLRKLNSLSFYKLQPPKSLGIEWVNEHIFPLLDTAPSVPSALNTYTVHIASQIASVLGNNSEEKVLITGGGAFNSFLIEEIRKNTGAHIEIPSAETVNFKEALIFGFLGVLRLRNEVNVLSSVTGASKNHSSGVIFEP